MAAPSPPMRPSLPGHWPVDDEAALGLGAWPHVPPPKPGAQLVGVCGRALVAHTRPLCGSLSCMRCWVYSTILGTTLHVKKKRIMTSKDDDTEKMVVSLRALQEQVAELLAVAERRLHATSASQVTLPTESDIQAVRDTADAALQSVHLARREEGQSRHASVLTTMSLSTSSEAGGSGVKPVTPYDSASVAPVPRPAPVAPPSTPAASVCNSMLFTSHISSASSAAARPPGLTGSVLPLRTGLLSKAVSTLGSKAGASSAPASHHGV